MKTENHTVFDAEALPLINPKGEDVLAVIIKATFDFDAEPSADQVPVDFGDRFYDEAEGGGVYYESDIVAFKPATDIVLCATAHAPDREPAESVPVSVRAGLAEKHLVVFGERFWNYAGVLSRRYKITRAKPFVRKSIVYKDAFGGIDPDTGAFCAENLSGTGLYNPKSRKDLAGKPLPCIEDPRFFIQSVKDRPPPAGLGFISRAWQPRAQYAGTYDEHWRKNVSPAPPEDFSARFYNGAHPDLRVKGYLQGDEPVELTNLTENGFVRFDLPGIKPYCRVHTQSDSRPVSMNLDTLFIEPDHGRYTLVWRGAVNVEDPSCPGVESIEIDARHPDMPERRAS